MGRRPRTHSRFCAFALTSRRWQEIYPERFLKINQRDLQQYVKELG